MSNDYLPINNSVLYLTTPALTDAQTGAAITNAAITASIIDGQSTLVSGSLTHGTGGVYSGTLNLAGLELNSHYCVQVAASNYPFKFRRLLRAENRT